jgi:signal transduction histidine kinase
MHRRLPRPTWVDVVLAVVVTTLGAVEVVAGQIRGPGWILAPSVLLFGVPLLWRRQFPWTALLISYGTMLGLHLLGIDQNNYLASVASALLIMVAFAAVVDIGQAVAGLVLASALLTVAALEGLTSIIWGVGLVVGAWAAGRALRARRLLIDELARTTEELRRSREAHAEAAVAAERTRIARELHDVIAHSVGVMVVQAGAAERMIPLDPARAVAATESVQECGRQALADLRNLLGLLRSTDEDRDRAGDLTPQPGLDDVPALLSRLEDAGLSVRLDRSGTPRPLPPGVDLAAFRIVQEALTNVLKHAATPSASMRVRYAEDGVDIEVVNPGGAPSPPACAGHGLVGMRERTAVHGGTFEAGPRDDGEFAVTVHLPAGAA